MSHLRHRTIFKNRPRGPIFIDSLIVTKVCYSISPLGYENPYLKKIFFVNKFWAAINFVQ